MQVLLNQSAISQKQSPNVDQAKPKVQLPNLQDPRVLASFDSSEGIENSQEKIPKDILGLATEYLPVIAYSLSSFMHCLSGLGKIFPKIMPKSTAMIFDLVSLPFSQTVNIFNYIAKGLGALKHNRSWDALGRLLYPLAVLGAGRQDVFLYSGLSSGITMYEQGQRDKVKNHSNLTENFADNFQVFLQMFKEIWAGGLGSQRKIFVSKDKEKGHTMFFSANGNFLGALLGIVSNVLKLPDIFKFAASLLRNAGSIACDYAKIIHPDFNNRMSGIFYLVVSVFDLGKYFVDKKYASAFADFSLASNNIANFFYVNTSKASDNKTYKSYAQAA